LTSQVQVCVIHFNVIEIALFTPMLFGDSCTKPKSSLTLKAICIGSVALALGLNEPLTEAVCLAHDLGHTPFGHAGQDALNLCMREILKHCSKRNARGLGELGKRFLQREKACLEAQIADISDAIAYNHHDIDDGLRAGILTVKGLQETSLFREQTLKVKSKYPDLDGRLLQAEIIRGMINGIVLDLIETSKANIKTSSIKSIEDVRQAGKQLVTLSDEIYTQHRELKSYLLKNFYRDPRIISMNKKAEKVIENLFELYMNDIKLLPEKHQELIKKPKPDTVDEPEHHQARKIADYIAGMTDRFAMQEHERLC